MKASELMIGDWIEIQLANGSWKSVKIDQIIRYPYEDYHSVKFYGDDSTGICLDDKCSRPIPLTAEILEKNGYLIKEQGKTNMLMVRHGDGYNIEVFLFPTNCVFKMEHAHYLGDNYVTDIVHKCGHYVHELQHALRLCGLNELANNFKI